MSLSRLDDTLDQVLTAANDARGFVAVGSRTDIST
jgi:hypothetical protein